MRDDVFSYSIDFNISNKSLPHPYIDKHYLCNQCLKFPYIKFCIDSKNIRLTCSCYNNKKILIKDLLDKNSLYIKKRNYPLSLTNLRNINNEDIEYELICKKHKQKYIGFSKIFYENYCQFCIDDKRDNDIIISFDDIKIEDKKIEQLLEKINNKNKLYKESIINNIYKFIEMNNNIYEKITKEEENFIELINIIINDYNNYPNFSHFFNGNGFQNVLIASASGTRPEKTSGSFLIKKFIPSYTYLTIFQDATRTRTQLGRFEIRNLYQYIINY